MLRGHCRINNWPNFNIVVSQRIGRPAERERGGGTDNGAVETDTMCVD